MLALGRALQETGQVAGLIIAVVGALFAVGRVIRTSWRFIRNVDETLTLTKETHHLVRHHLTRYVYEVIEETDDDELEFTDASAPSFLTELDEDDVDIDDIDHAPDRPDEIVIGFRRNENKEP